MPYLVVATNISGTLILLALISKSSKPSISPNDVPCWLNITPPLIANGKLIWYCISAPIPKPLLNLAFTSPNDSLYILSPENLERFSPTRGYNVSVPGSFCANILQHNNMPTNTVNNLFFISSSMFFLYKRLPMAIYCTQKIVLCLVNSLHLMTEATNIQAYS